MMEGHKLPSLASISPSNSMTAKLNRLNGKLMFKKVNF